MPSDLLLDALRQVVTNDLPPSLPSRVAFLVGSNPSKGARSPKLWNAAFAALGIDGAMFPLDVAADNIAVLLGLLDADRRVVGVAVAAPYKADFASLLKDRLTPAAKRCGSINLMSRDAGGHLLGSNTDGVGAIESLREVRPSFVDARILVLGCGGTGRAVIATLVDEVKPSGISVAIRSNKHADWLSSLGVTRCTTDLNGVDLSCFDVVINCTTMGWGEQIDSSPLADDQIARLRAECTVFDVVYQPDPTVLLARVGKLGLNTLSGTRMNLLQAVIAFSTANGCADSAPVAAAMKAAAAQ